MHGGTKKNNEKYASGEPVSGLSHSLAQDVIFLMSILILLVVHVMALSAGQNV
jgi:hypothetical protein